MHNCAPSRKLSLSQTAMRAAVIYADVSPGTFQQAGPCFGFGGQADEVEKQQRQHNQKVEKGRAVVAVAGRDVAGAAPPSGWGYQTCTEVFQPTPSNGYVMLHTHARTHASLHSRMHSLTSSSTETTLMVMFLHTRTSSLCTMCTCAWTFGAHAPPLSLSISPLFRLSRQHYIIVPRALC